MNQIDVSGWGCEFIIGSLSTHEFNKIMNNGNLNEIFQDDVEGIDDIVHICGPEINKIKIVDENNRELKLKQLIINFEPCYDPLEKKYLIEIINDEIKNEKNSIEIAEHILKTNSFRGKGKKTSSLVQLRSEKGFWGEFKFNSDIKEEHAFLLSVEMEGMEHISPNILIGLLIKEDSKFSFVKINMDESSTQTKSTEFYIFNDTDGSINEIFE